VVEGQTGLRLKQDQSKNGVGILQKHDGRNAKSMDSSRFQPLVPSRIAGRSVSA